MNWEVKYSQEQFKPNIPSKLWIYYYTVTEKFDRQLSETRPSPFNDGVVYPYGYSKTQSDRHARGIWDFIHAIAKHHKFTYEDMQKEKINISRLSQAGIEREYEAIIEMNGFEFINKYENGAD